MLNKKLLIISTSLLLVIALIFMFLYVRERKHAEETAFAYLNSIHVYVQAQLLSLPEDITQEEWELHTSYLQTATIGQGLYPRKNYGDSDAVCKAIQLLSYVLYDHRHEALDLIKELRIVFDTQNLLVCVEEGDIEQVIQRLALLSIE